MGYEMLGRVNLNYSICNARFFPNYAGKKRFAYRRTAANVTGNYGHRVRHAGRDCRHPGRKDASGNIRVTWVPALHAGTTTPRPNTRRVILRATTNMVVSVFG
jgi:hypothetical protein